MASPQIYQLPLGPLQTNCYILGDTETRKAAVVDPAWEGTTIARHLENEGWTLDKILLTHTHFDHVGGLAELKSAVPSAPIYAHEEALEMLGRAPISAQRWQFAIPDPPPVDHLLVEGDTVSVGSLTLEVLFTPGHAPGHLCFYLREHDVIFDGDVLFQGSIGRTDLPQGDHVLLIENIEEKLLVLPDETTVLSGHGPATTIGRERVSNPFLQDLG